MARGRFAGERPAFGPVRSSSFCAWWRVKAWDERGHATESTERAFWEMGLLERVDWKAQWIAGTLTGVTWVGEVRPAGDGAGPGVELLRDGAPVALDGFEHRPG